MKCKSKWAAMGLGRRSPGRVLGCPPGAKGQAGERGDSLAAVWRMDCRAKGRLGDNPSASCGNSPGEMRGLDWVQMMEVMTRFWIYLKNGAT